LAFYSKGTTHAKDVREQGAEEDIWAYQEGSIGKLEKTAQRGASRFPFLAKHYYRIRGWVSENKRSFRTPRRRWKDNIQMDLDGRP